MSGTFLEGSILNAKMESLFREADESLVIISPYIKLHNRFKNILKLKLNSPELNIRIVYRKNEDDKSKSFSQEDFDFLSKFPNIQIFYNPALHAKYYENEYTGILTSMNLYDYSQNNNIEFGVEYEVPNVDILNTSISNTASKFFNEVIDTSTLEYSRLPVYDKKAFGLMNKYSHSEVKTDLLSKGFSKSKKGTHIVKSETNKDFEINSSSVGYCIRTGKEIAFDIQIPYSDKAFKSWERFGDADYPEKYCHFSGEPSKGKTSMNKPVLSKYWSKAKLKK